MFSQLRDPQSERQTVSRTDGQTDRHQAMEAVQNSFKYKEKERTIISFNGNHMILEMIF